MLLQPTGLPVRFCDIHREFAVSAQDIRIPFAPLGPEARAIVTAFLFGMINAPERAKAARLVDTQNKQ